MLTFILAEPLWHPEGIFDAHRWRLGERQLRGSPSTRLGLQQ
jgi:hypothetical protein